MPIVTLSRAYTSHHYHSFVNFNALVLWEFHHDKILPISPPAFIGENLYHTNFLSRVLIA